MFVVFSLLLFSCSETESNDEGFVDVDTYTFKDFISSIGKSDAIAIFTDEVEIATTGKYSRVQIQTFKFNALGIAAASFLKLYVVCFKKIQRIARPKGTPR